MASGVGASQLANAQVLTANYAITSVIGAFSVSEEKLATLDFKYTTGAAEAATALKFKLEFSPDGTNWVQESYSSLSGGVNTLSPVEYSLAGGIAATTYTGQLLLPLCSSNVRVLVKETGVGANYGNATVWLSVVSNGGQQRNLLSSSAGGSVTDIDDDDIAKGQTLPLNINENYIFAKTADNWVRQQGTDDGYAFNRTIGIYTPDGDSAMDDVTDTVKVSGNLNATVTNGGIFVVQENGAALTALQSIDGKVTVCNTGAVVVSSGTINAQLTKVAGEDIQVANGTAEKSIRVTVANDSTGQIKLAAGTASVGTLGANSGVDIGDVTINNAGGASAVNIQDGGNTITVDNGGTFATQATLQTGSALVGDVGIGVRTTGGTTPYKNLDVDETEDEIKGTAGQLYWIHAINLKASVLYLKFYNATAAGTTVGTTVPVLTFPVPTLATTNGAGFNISIPNGIAFGTAMTVACTTGFADADTGAPGANELILNCGYT